MAFIGVLLMLLGMIAIIAGVIAFGIALIVIGAVWQRKGKHSKLALIFKIVGYIIAIPVSVITTLMIAIVYGSL